MATLPLKYVQKCHDALRYVDDYEVKSAHVAVYLQYTEISKEPYIDIHHYGTLIFRILPWSNLCCLFDGYSASDRNIINSFLMVYGMDDCYKVAIKNGKLELIELF